MCLQRPQDLTDNLGNRLVSLDFVDEDNNTCDYIEINKENNWTISCNDFTCLQLNIRGQINKQHDLLKLVNGIAGTK